VDMLEVLKTNKITEISDDLSNLLRDAGYLELSACIQCGTCSGSCPSGRRTALRTRSLMKKVQLGLKEEIFSDKELWFCSTCYTCLECTGNRCNHIPKKFSSSRRLHASTSHCFMQNVLQHRSWRTN